MKAWWDWFVEEFLKSVTILIGLLFLIVAIVMCAIGKITGEQFLIFLPIDAGIMFAKRAATQAITTINSNGGK